MTLSIAASICFLVMVVIVCILSFENSNRLDENNELRLDILDLRNDLEDEKSSSKILRQKKGEVEKENKRLTRENQTFNITVSELEKKLNKANKELADLKEFKTKIDEAYSIGTYCKPIHDRFVEESQRVGVTVSQGCGKTPKFTKMDRT